MAASTTPTISSYFCPPAIISTTPLGGGETEAPVSESSELKRAVPVSEVNPKKRAPGLQHSTRKLFLNEFCPRQAEGHRKCGFCHKAFYKATSDTPIMLQYKNFIPTSAYYNTKTLFQNTVHAL